MVINRHNLNYMMPNRQKKRLHLATVSIPFPNQEKEREIRASAVCRRRMECLSSLVRFTKIMVIKF